MAFHMEYNYEKAVAAIDKFDQNDLNSLREWTQGVEQSKHIPKDLTDQQLVLFYNACERDMDKTKKCILKYYSCRHNAPEFFSNRKVDGADLKESIDALEFAVLPKQTTEGYDIIFHRLHHTDPSKYHLVAGIKLLLMTVDLCLYMRGPQRGVVFLFDMRGVKLTHLTRLSMGALRKFFQYIQEGMPIQMREIHVMNTVPFFDKVLAILRPFMDKKLVDMINLHTADEDLSEFYKSIPRGALPPDYGGTLVDTRQLHAENTRRLRDMEPYFEQEQRQRGALGKAQPVDTGFARLEID